MLPGRGPRLPYCDRSVAQLHGDDEGYTVIKLGYNPLSDVDSFRDSFQSHTDQHLVSISRWARPVLQQRCLIQVLRRAVFSSPTVQVFVNGARVPTTAPFHLLLDGWRSFQVQDQLYDSQNTDETDLKDDQEIKNKHGEHEPRHVIDPQVINL